MTWDKKTTDINIATCHPAIRELVEKGINILYDQHKIWVRVTFGNRTIKTQNELYNQPFDGKDNDGDGLIDEADEKVTNATGGKSWHNYGLAFDCVEIQPRYGYDKHNVYPDERWLVIASVFKSLGFEWGGDWPKPKTDKPHFQMTFGLTLKEARRLYDADPSAYIKLA